MLLTLNSSIKKAISSTKAFFDALEIFGIKTVKDFLLYFPRSYEYHNESGTLSDIRTDLVNTIEAKVLETSSSLSQKTRKWVYKALLEDENGYNFEAVWFYRPYQLNSIREGEKHRFIGKIKFDFGKYTLMSPKIERLSERLHSRSIIPVYSATEQISSDWIMKKMESLIYLAKEFDENLPEKVLKEENLIKRSDAIYQIHFPDSEENLAKAKERLAFEELYKIHYDAFLRKKEFQRKSEKFDIRIPMNADLVRDFFKTLSFTPTNAQKVAIFEILKDMENDYPMSRLLEGDVGSGKTLVAATAALNAINAGFQVAIMAPTEVLARQHFNNLKELLKNSANIGLLLGSQKKKEKQKILLGILNGELNLLLGTHSLIQEGIEFNRLGLAIIDEQHRFGVEQRKRLSDNGAPHTLNMTATPIPRTLALVAYGDQDLSVLNEMPPGRQTIITKVVNQKGRIEINRFIDSQIENGRQVYVICPLIEESKSEIMAEVKSVTDEYKRLKEIFLKRRIEYLHGKMKSDEKNDVFNMFKAGKIDMLVSTSVIEVGIDVPNATIMLIEGVERFGLSQLHQFRGRVGRGEYQSYCFLFTTKESNEDKDRLKAMEKYSDGFRLAEIDLKLRGPGEVYGVRQSGIPDLKMAQLSDQKFVYRVKLAVEKYIRILSCV